MKTMLEQVIHYLSENFLTLDQLSLKSKIPTFEILSLVEHQCIPKHSYEWKNTEVIQNEVFGETRFDKNPGVRFYPHQMTSIVETAHSLAKQMPLSKVAQKMKDQFKTEFLRMFTTKPEARIAFLDFFNERGEYIPVRFDDYVEKVFQDWLQGVYGICVVDSASPCIIAKKEILQRYLKSLTKDGSKSDFTEEEKNLLSKAGQEYLTVTMPFAPHEYPRSSRKRFVDDIASKLVQTRQK